MIPGAGSVRRALGRLVRTGRPVAVVLLYHRVVDLECDPQWLAVKPKHFRMQIEELGRLAEVVPLSDLPCRLAGSRPRKPLVAITFDDGYQDNHQVAQPLLAAAGMPATVFVTTGFVDGGSELFWDDLERLILTFPGSLPARAAFLGSDIDLSQAESLPCDPGWNAVSPPRTGRQAIYMTLCRRAAALGHQARQDFLAALHQAVGVEPVVRPSHRLLNRDELLLMDGSGMLQIGSHTRYHLSLAAHPPDVQTVELLESRRYLELLLRHPVTQLAYPFGTLVDHDRQTRALAGQAGYSQACSNHPGLSWAGSDALGLPRFLVRDWEPAEFRRHFQSFIGW